MSKWLPHLLGLMITLGMGCEAPQQEASSTYEQFPFPITQLGQQEVSFTPGFWHDQYTRQLEKTLPHMFGMLDQFSYKANLHHIIEGNGGAFSGKRYQDSDVYKVIEAASWSLMQVPDTQLMRQIDQWVGLLAKAQEPSGYLHTHAQLNSTAHFQDLSRSHEWYNAGHLIEAGLAYAQATGKDQLLSIARRYADLIVQFIHTHDEVPGHPEIEFALMRLSQSTTDPRYAQAAQKLLTLRGQDSELPLDRRRYLNQHQPIAQQDSVVGHAVRALYLYTAATEMAVATRDSALINILVGLWEDICTYKLSLTGGVGVQGNREGFGPPYALDPTLAYNETCASVALMRWTYQLWQITGEAKFIDIFERILYNSLLAGISLSGDAFFYVNPLAFDGQTPFNREAGLERAAWFETACCPPNLSRMILSLPRYLYAHKEDSLYINLYANSRLSASWDQYDIELTQQTTYPYDAQVQLELEAASEDSIAIGIRIPAWAQNRPLHTDLYRYQARTNQKLVLSLNGKWIFPVFQHGYIWIKRIWRAEDKIELVLPISPRRVYANSHITALSAKQAFERGPIVYMGEQLDQTSPFSQLQLPAKGPISIQQDSLQGAYFPKLLVPANSPSNSISLLPYYLWSNRGVSPMQVWWPIRQEIQ